MSHSRLLSRLFRVGAISLQDLQEAAAVHGMPPEQALIHARKVTAEQLLQTLTAIHGVPAVHLSRETVDAECASMIPLDVAVGLGVLPLRREDGKLVVAMRNPSDLAVEEQLRSLTHCEIKRVVVLSHELEERLRTLAARAPRALRRTA